MSNISDRAFFAKSSILDVDNVLNMSLNLQRDCSLIVIKVDDNYWDPTQSAFTCWKLTIEILGQKSEIYSKLTIVNFEHISYLVMFLLLTLNSRCLNIEQELLFLFHLKNRNLSKIDMKPVNIKCKEYLHFKTDKNSYFSLNKLLTWLLNRKRNKF